MLYIYIYSVISCYIYIYICIHYIDHVYINKIRESGSCIFTQPILWPILGPLWPISPARSWWSITAWGHWAPFSVAEMLALKLMMVTFKDGSCSDEFQWLLPEFNYTFCRNTRLNHHFFTCFNTCLDTHTHIYICINKININIYTDGLKLRMRPLSQWLRCWRWSW
jgi:hypothetical protein